LPTHSPADAVAYADAAIGVIDDILADARRAARAAGPPRDAYSKQEAADRLGVSVDTLERRVLGDLRTVRLGGRVLIPRAELRRWLDANATRAVE
jgi:excisionase family DNA binding protein